MTRPFRGMINVLTFLSLVAFVATLALWVMSYRTPYVHFMKLGAAPTAERCEVILYRGRLLISNWPQIRADQSIQHQFLEHRMAILERKRILLMQPTKPGFEAEWARLDAETEHLQKPPQSTDFWSRSSRLPVPIVALTTAILPLLFAKRQRAAHRRARIGLCVRCGYDLRGTPDFC